MAVRDPDPAKSEKIGDFELARTVRREAALALSMSERLARVHALCKQMSAVKGAAAGCRWTRSADIRRRGGPPLPCDM